VVVVVVETVCEALGLGEVPAGGALQPALKKKPTDMNPMIALRMITPLEIFIG
jgi:hypothetical protein